MKIIDKVWDQGEGAENEDIAGQAGSFAWALDGATALVKHPVYSPRWLVEEADRVFAAGAQSCQSLQELFDYYLQHFPLTEECKNLQPEQKPSCAAAIIHVKNNTLEYITFADCYVVLKQGDDIRILLDERWASRPKADPKVMQAFLALSKEEQLQNQIKSRNRMNTPEGYWIGTADGEAFRHKKPQKIAIAPGTEIILCSDGFECAVDFKLYTWSEIFGMPLQTVLNNLRTTEKNDSEKKIYPRVKISDDAVAVKLMV